MEEGLGTKFLALEDAAAHVLAYPMTGSPSAKRNWTYISRGFSLRADLSSG
jgi:hypothetical protein